MIGSCGTDLTEESRESRWHHRQFLQLTAFGTGASQVGGVVDAAALRAIPGADQGVGDHERNVILIAPSAAFNSDGDVGQRQRVVAHANLRAGEAAGREQRRLSIEGVLQLSQLLLGQLHQVVVLDAAGGGQHDARRVVVGVDVVLQVLSRDRFDVLGGAEDGVAQRRSLIGGGVQVIEHDLLQVALHLLHLAQDDAALALDLGLAQLGVLDDVAEDFDGLRHVLRQTFGVEDGLLAAGVGVEVRAEVLDFQLEVGLRALGGAFERHVLEEVRDAVVLVVLVAGSGVDPQADGGSGGSGVLRGNAQTAVELCNLCRWNVHKSARVLSGIRRFPSLQREESKEGERCVTSNDPAGTG